jgi:hypothetical protein
VFILYYINMIQNLCRIFVNVSSSLNNFLYQMVNLLYCCLTLFTTSLTLFIGSNTCIYRCWVLCKYLVKNALACISVYLFIYLFTIISFIHPMCTWEWSNRRMNFSKKSVIDTNTQDENLHFCPNSKPHHIVVLQIYFRNFFYFYVSVVDINL